MKIRERSTDGSNQRSFGKGFISCIIALLVLSLSTVFGVGFYDITPAHAQATPRTHNCNNLLVNGGAEANNGWSAGNTPFPAAYVTSPVHDGSRALRLGVPSGVSNAYSHSSIFQRVTIPSDATRVLFNFWEYTRGGSDGRDYREIALFSENFRLLDLIRRETGAGNNEWTQSHWFDLTQYKGQTVILYMNVYNNGSGSRMWSYLDNISLIYCPEHEGDHATNTPIATPTTTLVPTATPTRTPNATPTWTPVAASTPTPAFTPTWTPAPSTNPNGSALVRIGNSNSNENAITVPLEVVNIPQGRTVSALSIHVRYDTSRLQATDCQVNTILTVLCNISRPGRIQISAISANGISANFVLANLTVNILKVDAVPSVLDVDVISFVDPQSNAIPAIEQNGEITTLTICTLGDVNCDRRIDVSDALFILQHDAGLRQASNSHPLPANTLFYPACDVNGDTHCNVVDSLVVLQCSVGIDNGSCGARAASRSVGGQLIAPTRRNTGNTQIYVDSAIANTDGSLSVPIMLNTTDNVGAASVKVQYDPKLLQLTGCVADPEERFDISLCNITAEQDGVNPDIAQFNVVSLDGISGADIPLVELQFEPIGLRRDGATVNLEVITATDEEGLPISASTQSGEVLLETVVKR